MANEITIDFGTLNLKDTNNITISGISVSEKKSVNLSKIPKSDHSVAETGRREALIITVEGDIAGTEYDNLRTNLDTLKAGLQDGFQKFTIDDDRYVMAQLRDFDYQYIHPRVAAKWRAVFVAHYPFWLAETPSTDTRTPVTTVGFTLANAGNAPTRVKLVATAGAEIDDDFQIENSTTGEILKYRGTVAAGEALEIDNRYDTDEFEVLNDGDDDKVNFEGDFLTLDPGNNTIVVTCANMPEIVFTWRGAWY